VTGPTRASVAGRAYLDLRNKARRERRPTQTFHIDVSVGDPVWPAPEMIELPGLLKGRCSCGATRLRRSSRRKLSPPGSAGP